MDSPGPLRLWDFEAPDYDTERPVESRSSLLRSGIPLLVRLNAADEGRCVGGMLSEGRRCLAGCGWLELLGSGRTASERSALS